MTFINWGAYGLAVLEDMVVECREEEVRLEADDLCQKFWW